MMKTELIVQFIGAEHLLRRYGTYVYLNTWFPLNWKHYFSFSTHNTIATKIGEDENFSPGWVDGKAILRTMH